MLTKLRRTVRPYLDRLGRALATSGVHPNHITALSLLTAAALPPVLILFGPLPASVIILASAALDVLDGAVARAGGMVSRVGAIFDSFADRVSDAFFIGSLVLTGIHPLLVIASLTSSFLISYLRARGEAAGLRMEGVGLMERGDRVLALFLIYLVTGLGSTRYGEYALAVFFALTSATVIQRWATILGGAKE